MQAIIDCNSFYCSCERLFAPTLQNAPIVVLSNNDGCIVSRSDEAKKLGIAMAAPYFQEAERIKQFGVHTFSSNYHLYGDLSWRVMETMRSLLPKDQVEVYSEASKLQDFKIKLLSIILGTILFGSILLYVNFRQKGLLTQNRIQLDLEHERNAVLLKELHHRMKNNLQVIYSLLNLQKRRTKNEESIDLITALQNRIQTIALVHNNLFQTDEMEYVALDSYVRTLVEHLQQMYAQDELNPVTIDFKMQDSIRLRFERIGTLGLIINEIVSNAFKYAFVGDSAGVLTIEIEQKDTQVILSIEDNGPGRVEEINQNSNLGMRLIRILSEQMGATYTLHQSQGIKHLLQFMI